MTKRMERRLPHPCPVCGSRDTVKASYNYYGKRYCCIDCVIEFEEVRPGFYEIKDINADGNLVNDRYISHNGNKEQCRRSMM